MKKFHKGIKEIQTAVFDKYKDKLKPDKKTNAKGSIEPKDMYVRRWNFTIRCNKNRIRSDNGRSFDHI